MTDSYLRRTVLALTGGLLAGSATASADHEHEKKKQTHSKCDRCEYDCKTGCKREKVVYTGLIKVTNREGCQQKVYVDTSERTFDMQVAPGETKREWIEGNIERLEAEPGELEIEINQPRTTQGADDRCHH